MARLPVCSPDDLRSELDEIERDLLEACRARPVSLEAAERLDERIVGLRRWRRDLRAQLAEVADGSN